MNEGSRQLDTLLVAVRKLLEPALGSVGKAQPIEPCRRCRLGGMLVHAVKAGEVDELRRNPHSWVEAPLLGHIAKTKPRLRGDG